MKIVTSFITFACLTIALAFTANKNLRWSVGYLLSHGTPARTPMARLPGCPGCNLVLISLDTLRADRMGYLGSKAGLTPNLDRIAARSVVFENAFTNAWFTTPSHMTVFTSVYPQTHRVESERMHVNPFQVTAENGHALDKRLQTLAEVLRDHGYATYWKAPLHLKYFDFDNGFARGFTSTEAPPFDRIPVFSGHKAFDSAALAPLADSKRPVFMFLHSYMTHLPHFSDELAGGEDSRVSYSRRVFAEYRDILTDTPEHLVNESDKSPAEFSKKELAAINDRCGDIWDLSTCFTGNIDRDVFWHAVGVAQAARANRVIRSDTSDTDIPRQELKTFINTYDSAVQSLDAQVGTMWKALEDSGALKNTIVVFISDHGEELFEHKACSHTSFYDHTQRVPVMVYHPKLPAGERVAQLFSLVDLMPMMLEMLGVATPAQAQGHAPWTASPKYVYGYTLGTDVVRSQDWKLMRTYSGTEELYYLPTDPEEHQDLTGLQNPWVQKAYDELALARKNWEAEQAL